MACRRSRFRSLIPGKPAVRRARPGRVRSGPGAAREVRWPAGGLGLGPLSLEGLRRVRRGLGVYEVDLELRGKYG